MCHNATNCAIYIYILQLIKNSFAISMGSGWPSSSLGSRRKTGHSHTYQYLHFKSTHLTHMKRGVVRCLHDRTWGIINIQDNLQKEVDHLARVLKQIGFPANFSTTLLPHPHRKQQTEAPQTRDKRRRGHWWYPMWQVWVRTSSACFCQWQF